MGIGSGFVPELKLAAGGVQDLVNNPLLKYKRLSIDASCVIHLALVQDGVAGEFHTYPRQPLETFAKAFKSRILKLLSIPCTAILVFDDAPHVLKSATNAGRKSGRDAVRPRMEELLKRSDLSKNEILELGKLRRKCVEVTEDVLAAAIDVCRQERWEYVCAPFEADFQVGDL